jgi:hypothetical protein
VGRALAGAGYRAAARPARLRVGLLDRWRAMGGVTQALAVFLAAFLLYAVAASDQPQGYVPETAAVAEGFWRTGDFVVLDSEIGRQDNAIGFPDANTGKRIGRAGLPSVAFKLPWLAVGDVVGDPLFALTFAVPFVGALAALAFFLVAVRIREDWALALTALFAVASIAFPYSKMGQETVLQLALLTAFAGALRDGRGWAVLSGVGAGMVLAEKPWAVVALVPLLWVMPRRNLGWFLLPVALWLVAEGFYNDARTGSPLDTGRNEPSLFAWAFPFNFIGFLVSPGKGLLWYSPLVALGLLGLWRMRLDRPDLARVLALSFGLGTLTVSTLVFWSDGTWGPRYLVAIAWIPLLGIPWFVTSVARRRVLYAVAAIAVAVQLTAVTAPTTTMLFLTDEWTGQEVFQHVGEQPPVTTPFGRDPFRWIPELSPLLFQAKLFVSPLKANRVAYHPFEGPDHELTLDGYEPDFWWAQ